MISQGILEVCKELPEDPVDYLSDYLVKRQNEVLNFSRSGSKHSKKSDKDKSGSSNKSSKDEGIEH